MAHLTQASGYHQLVQRLNRFPQGAPPSQSLYQILKILFSPREAERVARLPIRVFSDAEAARAWGLDLTATRKQLEALCSRALLVDIVFDGVTRYCLPPVMAGFLEFSMMRVRTDFDQKALAELIYRYINVEEDFAAALFGQGQTQMGRALVDEDHLGPALALEMLASKQLQSRYLETIIDRLGWQPPNPKSRAKTNWPDKQEPTKGGLNQCSTSV
ncbi:MAG: hypothetical protein M0036_00675 [Desulfobacteraceae bacterium]|nr:hypothetical protein [Desulfobacteraceae bacterium]